MAKKKQAPAEFEAVLERLVTVATEEVADEHGIELYEEAPAASVIITNESQRRQILDEIHSKVALYFNRILDDALAALDTREAPYEPGEEQKQPVLSPQMISAITKFLNDNNAKLGLITPQSPMGNLLSKLPYINEHD